MYVQSTVTVPLSVHLENYLTMITIAIAYLVYRLEKRKENREKLGEEEKIIQQRDLMHEENERKLNTLIESQSDQEKRNEKLDAQVDQLKTQTNELSKQTALLAQMSDGQEQRLRRVERKQDEG